MGVFVTSLMWGVAVLKLPKSYREELCEEKGTWYQDTLFS